MKAQQFIEIIEASIKKKDLPKEWKKVKNDLLQLQRIEDSLIERYTYRGLFKWHTYKNLKNKRMP